MAEYAGHMAISKADEEALQDILFWESVSGSPVSPLVAFTKEDPAEIAALHWIQEARKVYLRIMLLSVTYSGDSRA